MSFVKCVECSRCGCVLPWPGDYGVCPSCDSPLLVRYRTADIKRQVRKTALLDRPNDMWRYVEVLPVDDEDDIVTLGEGYTPLLTLSRLGKDAGLSKLYLKDESLNPTGTFKARGLSVSVSMARKLGHRKLALPSAGNAGGALAAYGARAGVEVLIAMPLETPSANVVECRMSGAEVELTPGSISDAARSIRQRQAEEGWFDMSTLKEPYRLEGKKTIGYELMEQFRWRVPDVFICPVGGGMSLIGVWKALQEMEELGWINSKRPRMVAVQAEGCAPLAKAFEEGAEAAPPWPNPTTFAAGIRVPAPLGDFLILKTVRQSRGTALAVSDAEIYQAILEICRAEGLFACPEGAACWAALKKLRQARWVKDDETVVLLNTGAGVKYIDALTRFEQTLRT